MRTEQEYTAAVEQGKQEITEDVGVQFERRPRSFTALNDVVDANEYAGFCAERSDWLFEDVAVVQERLDRWLQDTAPPEEEEYVLAPRQESVSVEYEPQMGFARVVLEITEDGAYSQHSLTFSLDAFEDLRRLVDLAVPQAG